MTLPLLWFNCNMANSIGNVRFCHNACFTQNHIKGGILWTDVFSQFLLGFSYPGNIKTSHHMASVLTGRSGVILRPPIPPSKSMSSFGAYEESDLNQRGWTWRADWRIWSLSGPVVICCVKWISVVRPIRVVLQAPVHHTTTANHNAQWLVQK